VLRRRRHESRREAAYYRQNRYGRDHGEVVSVPEVPDARTKGPWDAEDDYPNAERIDCGSLLVPVREGFDVEINMADAEGSWVAVVHGDSGMQLQAFAAPRGDGLWDEVRAEIAENVAESGGSSHEEPGAHGTEVRAQVPIGEVGEAGEPGGAGQRLHPIRFLGSDGPRWFLRGVISGPAATDRDLSAPFDDIFADVVVVRGDYPAPQRQLLEIRLPEEMRQAIEAEAGLAETGQETDEAGWSLRDPFNRGPEITETR
jgi:hypothetical protein